MKLIVLGNGFDLHHGLKTSFDNFKNYCQDKEFVTKVDKIIKKHMNDSDKTAYLSWANIEEIFHEEYLEIEEKNNLKKELDTYDNVKRIKSAAEIISAKKERDYVRENLKIKIEEIQTKYTLDTFFSLSLDFTDYFNKYLKTKIIHEVTSTNYELKKEFNDGAHILNFNYTNTHKFYSDKLNTLCIHGNIKDGLFPVIGYYHDVKYPIHIDSSDVHVKYEDKVFSKDTIFERMHNKELVPIVQDFFKPLEKKISEIVIIGYSIGNSDDFVNQLILNNCKMHDENGFLPIGTTIPLEVLKVKIYNYTNSFESGKQKIKSLLGERYKTVTIYGDSIRGRKIPNVEFIEKQYK